MSAPPLTLPDRDMPLEQVPPVQRELPPLRRASRRSPRALAAVALLAAVAASIAAISTDNGLPREWTVASGSLVVDGAPLEVGALAPLDTAITGGETGGRLESASGTLTLAPTTEVALADPEGRQRALVELLDGQLLVEVPLAAAVSVDSTAATVTGTGGVFRVERDDSPRVASYSANMAVDGDRDTALARLTEVRFDGDPGRVLPISLDPSDPWDQAHAAGPLATDEQVGNLLAGLRASYGVAPQTPAFYGDFVGVTDGLVEVLPLLSPVVEDGRYGPPAETLIAAASLAALVERTGLPLEQLLAEVLASRAAGGSWGVLLAQQDVDAAFLRRVADDALRRRAAQGDAAAPVIDPPTAQPPATPGTSDDGADGSDGAAPPPDPAPPTDEEPPTSDPSEPSEPPEQPEPEPEPEDPGPIEDPIGTIEDIVTPGDDGGLPLDDLLDGVTGAVDDLVGGLLGSQGDADDAGSRLGLDLLGLLLGLVR